MQADTAQLDLLALGRRRVQQPWKPCQGYAERPSVGQLDPHRVFVKSNAGRRNDHAMPSKESVGWVEPFAKPIISGCGVDGYRFAPPILRATNVPCGFFRQFRPRRGPVRRLRVNCFAVCP
jgi:hypothetical protein